MVRKTAELQTKPAHMCATFGHIISVAVATTVAILFQNYYNLTFCRMKYLGAYIQ